MQHVNAKDDAVEGGPVRLRPWASSRQASSQPIAPAAGLSPPQPAGKSIAYSAAVGDEAGDCEFLFAALAEKHNTVIRKIREIPPWEWDREFLELGIPEGQRQTIQSAPLHRPCEVWDKPRPLPYDILQNVVTAALQTRVEITTARARTSQTQWETPLTGDGCRGSRPAGRKGDPSSPIAERPSSQAY